jgi:hypothetical protein
MEGVMRNISSVIVYINDLLVHTTTHEEHLKILEQVLERLHAHNLKINLDKCCFGNKEVSYLGFTLTPAGIKPGKNKVKAIKNAKPPTDVKTIRSFVGLCNFFRTHIKIFARIGAILTQKDEFDNFYAISDTSRQLKDHEKNYSPFLLEAAAAVWGMDVFNEYLKGKFFILYMYHKPLEKMGHLHTKTMNRLQAALLEHDFVIQYKKGEIMPADYLYSLFLWPIRTQLQRSPNVSTLFNWT